MTSIFRSGLLLIFVGTVSAEFEYSADFVASLPDYQDVADEETGSPDFEVFNPEIALLLNKKPSQTLGLHLCLNNEWVFENPIARYDRTESQKLLEYSTHPAISFDYSKRPGLYVTLPIKVDPLERCFCILPNIGPVEKFYFTEMDVDMKRNRDDNLYMNVELKFDNLEIKKTIKLVMQLFKPAIDEADKLHCNRNRVPVITSPIFLKKLSETSHIGVKRNDGDSNRSIIFGMSWMDDVLNNAKLQRSEKEGSSAQCTWVYTIGPVIIEPEEYIRILNLMWEMH